MTFHLVTLNLEQDHQRWLQHTAQERLNLSYTLLQQSKTNERSMVEAEALLTRDDVRVGRPHD